MIRSSWFIVDVPGNVGLPPNICSPRARANKHVNPPNLLPPGAEPSPPLLQARQHHARSRHPSRLYPCCTPRVAQPRACPVRHIHSRGGRRPPRCGSGDKTRRHKTNALSAALRVPSRSCLYRHWLIAHRTMAPADTRATEAGRGHSSRGAMHQPRMTLQPSRSEHLRQGPRLSPGALHQCPEHCATMTAAAHRPAGCARKRERTWQGQAGRCVRDQTSQYAHPAHQAHRHAVYRARPGEMQCSTKLVSLALPREHTTSPPRTEPNRARAAKTACLEHHVLTPVLTKPSL